MRRVLLVEDDADLRDALVQAFDLAGFFVESAEGGEAALGALGGAAETFAGAVVSDIRMPGLSGIALLARLRALDPDLPVVLITGHGDVPLAVEAMRGGAYDFVEKPFDTARLIEAAARAVEKRRLVLENRALRERGPDDVPVSLLGTSPVARAMAERFAGLREARSGALVVAPRGAGVEGLARGLATGFAPSRRVDCSNLGDLAELELFADGGAVAACLGGALVLENVETLPARLQVRLAAMDATGDPVLVLSTANPSRLEPTLADAFAGRRLDVAPLDRRREDLPALFVALAARAAARFLRPVPDLPAGFETTLVQRTFEGDVVELQALAERFVLGLAANELAPGSDRSGRLSARVAAHEKLLVEAELARNDYAMRPTYEALGLSRKGLYDKMRRHGITVPGGG